MNALVPARFVQLLRRQIVPSAGDRFESFAGTASGLERLPLVPSFTAFATITLDEPDIIGRTLRQLWERHPSDAAYMDVKLRGGVPDEADFRKAVENGVLVRLVLRDS